MTTRLTTLAVLAAFGLASAPAVAATSHHHATKAGTATPKTSVSPDHSADDLNAQSLNAARSGTAFAPGGAQPAASDAKPAMQHGKKAAPSKS